MRLLIDGYNLLHATDLFGEGPLEGTLRGSREALLDFLARNLSERERKATTIIFDAAQAPPNLPSKYHYEGILVWFARDYPDADSLMEELLETYRSARDLTVVSHDRRVQRAARSAGAKPVDSNVWFRDIKIRSANQNPIDTKPIAPFESSSEWTKTFQDEQLQKEIKEHDKQMADKAARAQAANQPSKKLSKHQQRKKEKPSKESSHDEFGKGIFDPFPPGYGEDLLEE